MNHNFNDYSKHVREVMVHTVICVYCCCFYEICFIFYPIILFFLLMHKNTPKSEFVNMLFVKNAKKKEVNWHRWIRLCQFSTLESAIVFCNLAFCNLDTTAAEERCVFPTSDKITVIITICQRARAPGFSQNWRRPTNWLVYFMSHMQIP